MCSPSRSWKHADTLVVDCWPPLLRLYSWSFVARRNAATRDAFTWLPAGPAHPLGSDAIRGIIGYVACWIQCIMAARVTQGHTRTAATEVTEMG